MGGSLSLALKGHCAALMGVDSDPLTLSLARQRNVVERISSDPAEILPHADVIVLAVPVREVIKLIHDLPDLHPGEAVVLDMGSTKSEIVRAMATLPSRFDPLGGHPMCGKEKLSLANADPTIFLGAPFAFTTLPRTSLRTRALANQMARAIGAHPLWLDPETHDSWAAVTSHLPYLVSVALALATPTEAASLTGSGFRSATRLASTPSSMMLDILTTNKTNILDALAGFRKRLDELEQTMANNNTVKLKDLLDTGASCSRFLRNHGKAGQP